MVLAQRPEPGCYYLAHCLNFVLMEDVRIPRSEYHLKHRNVAVPQLQLTVIGIEIAALSGTGQSIYFYGGTS